MARLCLSVFALGLVCIRSAGALPCADTEDAAMLQTLSHRGVGAHLGQRQANNESSASESRTSQDTMVAQAATFEATGACDGGISFVLGSAALGEGVNAGYSIEGGKCSGYDGPNGSPSMCCLPWGAELGVSGHGQIPAITHGATIAITADISIGTCTWGGCWWQQVATRELKCPACGGVCSFDVDSGIFSFPALSFDMPACPITGFASNDGFAYAMPTSSPFGQIGVKVDFRHGRVSNGDGSMLVKDISFRTVLSGHGR